MVIADLIAPPRRSWFGLRSWGGFGVQDVDADCRSGAVLEAPAFVAGLDDLAMVGEPIEHGGGHLGVAEQVRLPPFPKGSYPKLPNKSVIKATFI